MKKKTLLEEILMLKEEISDENSKNRLTEGVNVYTTKVFKKVPDEELVRIINTFASNPIFAELYREICGSPRKVANMPREQLLSILNRFSEYDDAEYTNHITRQILNKVEGSFGENKRGSNLIKLIRYGLLGGAAIGAPAAYFGYKNYKNKQNEKEAVKYSINKLFNFLSDLNDKVKKLNKNTEDSDSNNSTSLDNIITSGNYNTSILSTPNTGELGALNTGELGVSNNRAFNKKNR